MKVLTLTLAATACMSLLAACGTQDNSDSAGGRGAGPSRDQVVIGKINGSDFVFRSGRVRKHSSDPNLLTFTLFGTEIEDPCNAGALVDPVVMFSLPAAIGSYIIGMQEDGAMTLYLKESSTVLKGKIVLDKIGSREAEGALSGSSDHENYLNGTFKVKVCE